MSVDSIFVDNRPKKKVGGFAYGAVKDLKAATQHRFKDPTKRAGASGQSDSIGVSREAEGVRRMKKKKVLGFALCALPTRRGAAAEETRAEADRTNDSAERAGAADKVIR